MRSNLSEPVKRDPPARERFIALRDAARKRSDANPKDLQSVVDWNALCLVVRDKIVVIVYLRKRRTLPGACSKWSEMTKKWLHFWMGRGVGAMLGR